MALEEPLEAGPVRERVLVVATLDSAPRVGGDV
jgi:hypothetical protein